VNRGEVWEHPLRGRRFVIVSTDHLTVTGTVILVEIASEVPAGTRGMLAVHLTEHDDVGGAAIGYRLNWQAARRMANWKYLGRVSENNLEVIDMALRTSMDL
jgi:mRNA-degrading endonuclease toxin of MazEF toxin-antitoxin module